MKILDYIFAARPMLHLPLWSIYLVSLHYHHGLSGKSFSFQSVLMMLILSLIAAGAYYINQITDFESDRLNNKIGFLQQNYCSARVFQILFIIFSVISITAGLLFSFFAGFVIAQLVVLGYLYSAPPFRFKDRPFFGLWANGWSYGFLIPFLVMPEIGVHNAGLLGWDNPFYFYCAVSGVFLLTTIPDKAGDMATGKKTVATKFPLFFVKLTAIVFFLGAAFFAYHSNFITLVIVALLSSVPVIVSLFIQKDTLDRFVAKWPILLLTVLAGYHYPFYLIFVVALLIITRIYYAKRRNQVYPQVN